jgi:hypothetical protein
MGDDTRKTEALSNGKNRRVRPRVYTDCRAAGRRRVGCCKSLARDRDAGPAGAAASPMIEWPAARLISEVKNGDGRLFGAEFASRARMLSGPSAVGRIFRRRQMKDEKYDTGRTSLIVGTAA